MARYRYKVKDQQGKTLTGLVEATDEKNAVKILHERDYLIIKLKIKKDNPLSGLQLKMFRRVSLNDKVNFTRQFSTMITAGLRITDALKILELQSSAAFRPILREILSVVEGGGSLALAMEKFPAVFDQIYVALIKAGESAGVLDRILARLADNLEKKNQFGRQLKGAMIYPAIIISGMGVVGMIMVLYVIPKMMVIYQEFQAELPLPTKILLAISQIATRLWFLLPILLVGVVFGWPILRKNPTFKKELDRFLFKIPIIGKLRQKSILAEFTRTLSLLSGAGILIVEALKIVRRSLGSPLYEEAVAESEKEVEKGYPLATALGHMAIFPPILPQMVSVGEETGKLDEVLAKISVYFEQETEQAVKNLTTAMEPLIMILLGIGVAFLVISIIMPIYNLTSQF